MTWRVGVDRDLPVEGGAWDGPAAAQAVWNAARNADGEIQVDQARRAFLIYDDAKDTVTEGYKLPIARRRDDGSLIANADGLRNALSRIPQVDGVPTEVRDRASSAARALLEKFNEQRGDGKIIERNGKFVYVPSGHEDRIEMREGKFCAVSKDGSKSFGCFDTEDEARERLRQVEAAVAAKGDSVIRVDKLGPLHCDKARTEGFFCETTDEGFLKTTGLLSRTGVFTYSDADGNQWGEFRDEREVFNRDSLDSFKMVVITDDHPQSMVTTDNVKDVQVGHVGSDVRRDGEFIRASLLITDPQVIRSVRDGKVELSCGYFAQVVQDSGVAPDGTPFTSRQKQIRGNHLALVDVGRAGPSCRLQLDSGDAVTTGDIFMTTEKKDGTVLVGGEEHDVPDAVSEAFGEMQDRLERQAAELARLKEPASEERERDGEGDDDLVVETVDTMDKMQAQVDSLKAQLKEAKEGQSAVIDARVALLTKAREILPAELTLDGVATINIQRAVVAQVTPAMKDVIKDKSADYVQAAYDMALQQHESRIDSSAQLLEETTQAVADGADDDIDKIYRDSVKRIHDRGREPQKETG